MISKTNDFIYVIHLESAEDYEKYVLWIDNWKRQETYQCQCERVPFKCRYLTTLQQYILKVNKHAR